MNLFECARLFLEKFVMGMVLFIKIEQNTYIRSQNIARNRKFWSNCITCCKRAKGWWIPVTFIWCCCCLNCFNCYGGRFQNTSNSRVTYLKNGEKIVSCLIMITSHTKWQVDHLKFWIWLNVHIVDDSTNWIEGFFSFFRTFQSPDLHSGSWASYFHIHGYK